MTKRTYYGAVERGKKSFGIVFPDFPGCISSGDTLEEVLLMGREALQGHIEVMIEYGEAIPAPTDVSFDSVRGWLGAGNWVSITAIDVDVPKPGKSVFVPLDRKIVTQIDALKIERSKFIAQATRNELIRLKKSA